MSEPVPESLAPLSVAADLTVTVDGAEVTVESTGERLLVRIDSLPDALRVARGRPAALEERLSAVLAATDLTAEIRVRDRVVAVVGADAGPGPLSRVLGVAPAEIRVGGVVATVVAEAAATLGVGRG